VLTPLGDRLVANFLAMRVRDSNNELMGVSS
jgi:hypothetical protein